MTEIRKSSLDKRAYRSITLPNQLKCLLVSDSECDKAGCALAVQVGSHRNPPEFPGLAHFLEHMLFLGTRSYPEENAYSSYLSSHGGHSNAYTAPEETNYYFDVGPEHLQGALDRFSKFFHETLLSSDGVERELNAVDSEFKKNLQSDMRRFHQVLKSLCDPAHPFSHFDSGNLRSLKEEPTEQNLNVLDALKKFYASEYGSEKMAVCVLGREDLDILEFWVRQYFSPIQTSPQHMNPRTQRPTLYESMEQHPMGEKVKKKLICIKSIKDVRQLALQFAFPDQLPHWRIKPSHYLSHLIGHESEGSILHLLKREGLASSLMSGESREGHGFSIFSVSINLTKEGMQHYERVLEIIFAYIETIRHMGVQKWIFDECQQLSRISFQFSEKTSPANFVSRTASHLLDYPFEYALAGPYVVEDYDEAVIGQMMDCLRVENLAVFFVAKEGDLPQSSEYRNEKWFGTEYAATDIPSQLMDKLKNPVLDPSLHAPAPNPFIPSNLNVLPLKNEPTKFPSLILDTPHIRLWHKKDVTFHVPKTNVFLLIKSPAGYLTPKHSVLTRLYLEMIKEELNAYSYMADVAGLSYSMEVIVEGIIVLFGGFSDKMGVLLEKVLKTLRDVKLDEKRFDILKDKVGISYKGWMKEQPHQHAMYFVTFTLQQYLWTPMEKLEIIDGITLKDLERFKDEFFGYTHMEAWIHGNTDQEQALEYAQICKSVLTHQGLDAIPLPKSLHFTMRSHLLPEEHRYVYIMDGLDADNPNSSIEYFIQVGDPTNKLVRNYLFLLGTMIQEAAFNQLRTKEQLGYIVWASMRKIVGVMGLKVIIQSERSPQYLEERIESFLSSYADVLNDMPDNKFKEYVDAAIAALLQKDDNLARESSRWWRHIQSGYYEFNQVDTDVEVLRAIRAEEFKQFYHDIVHPEVGRASRLSVHVCAKKLGLCIGDKRGEKVEVKRGVERVWDLVEFKRGLILSSTATPQVPEYLSRL